MPGNSSRPEKPQEEADCPPRPSDYDRNYNAAVAYKRRVMAALSSQEYAEVVRKIEAHWNLELTATEMILQICQFFRDHEDLLRGFNILMPDGHLIFFENGVAFLEVPNREHVRIFEEPVD